MLYIVNEKSKKVYLRRRFGLSAMEEVGFWLASHACREVRRQQIGDNRYIFVLENDQ